MILLTKLEAYETFQRVQSWLRRMWYPSIPDEVSLKALREALDNRKNKHILTYNLLKMAELVLKNNCFEFNGKVKKQFSGTAIGTKFAPTYASVFTNKLESGFLKF